MQIPKPERETDEAYLDFVRSQPCLCKGNDKGRKCLGDIAPHHTKTVGSGGSDYGTVPLCAEHHTECHSIGRDTFQDKYGISFRDTIARLRTMYAIVRYETKHYEDYLEG